ncbi:hypothetical protein B0H16DRAFT_1748858 [Mycena metata]|uniref:Uncharacterized protein n=1 Tax=Mycena metata TaxID=1033252 RepID=A0AAD7DY55_9AGAR|nr:hypothetical protein B0H16DRAFT_1748858 [Mycena metata]
MRSSSSPSSSERGSSRDHPRRRSRSPTRRPSPSRQSTSSSSRRGANGHHRSSNSSRRGRSPPRESPSTDDSFDYKAAYHMVLAETQRKRKRDQSDSVQTVSIQNLGRGVRKLAALFGEICHIIVQAQAYKKNPMPEDHGINRYSMHTTEDQHQFLDKKRRQVVVPDVDSKTQLQKGANDARSDDFKRVSVFIPEWINKDLNKIDSELAVFDHTPSITVINETTGQDTRGVEHNVIGGLLTSTATDWNDAKQRAAARSGGRVHLAGSYFLRIFYDRFQGDPKNAETGFMKSSYLVKAYKAVFTAPSSVEQGQDQENVPPSKRRKPSGKCVAMKLGMNGVVTARSVAYIGCILWLSLTTTVTWQDKYYSVSLPQMYDFLVDFFEEPEEGTQARERVDALLAWWNHQIFPTHVSSAATNQVTAASRSVLLAQRAAMEDED